MRIMLVDDHHLLRQSLKRQLEEFGHEVVADVADGISAIAAALKNQPDIILMDMMMPNKDGYETTIEIRKNEKLKTIPIIAVTAKAMLGDRQKCINVGASDYVTKPVDGDQLLSLLRVWLYK